MTAAAVKEIETQGYREIHKDTTISGRKT